MHIVHTDANGWSCALVCELGNRTHMERFWAAFWRLGPVEVPGQCWEDTGVRVWVFRIGEQWATVRESYGEFITEGPATILEPLAAEIGPDPEGSHLPRHTVVELPDEPGRPKRGDPGVPF
jgi:hypothetical protein